MMRAFVKLFLFFFICSPLMVHADEAARIEEILYRQSFSPGGEIMLSEVTASVEGCAIRIRLERTRGCVVGESFFSTTDYIDLRSLVTNKEAAEFRDLSGTRHESLNGSVTYRYRFFYDRVLRSANKRAAEILDQEYENFPSDVDSRLRVLSRRYRQEIDPRTYSMSFETTENCSGGEIRSPLTSRSYVFWVEPSESVEFAELIENLAQGCGPEVGS